MVGFLSKIFGKSGGAEERRGEGVPYKDCIIYPAPQNDGGSWRTAGVIVKKDSDPEIAHKFIRADIFTSREEAEACATRKGKQIIDERGTTIFNDAGQPEHG